MSVGGRINFTQKNIEGLAAPSTGEMIYKDEKTQYLTLRIFPSGKKTYTYIRKIDGKVRFIKLGDHPGMTVLLARKKAAEHSGSFANGVDPVEEKRKAKSRSATLANLFNAYLEDHLKTHAKTYKEDVRMFNKYLTPLASRQANKITSDDLRKHHRSLGEHNGHRQANRVLQLARRIYSYAIKKNGYTGCNPAAAGLVDVNPKGEQERERFLSLQELETFFAGLEKLTPERRDFFTLALLTGARRSNISSMEWDELDFNGQVWNIPGSKTKNGKPIHVVLCKEATEILERLWRNSKITETPYVFPGRGVKGHYDNTQRAWRNLLRETGLKDLKMHDLRRTLASYQAKNGTSLLVIAKTLGACVNRRNKRLCADEP